MWKCWCSIVLIFGIGCGTGTLLDVPVVEASCGNAACDRDETCSDCPEDCGACPVCGDAVCNGVEACSDCPIDCGTCPGCGDGTCSGTESCSDCPADCGMCPGCGDGSCSGTENCAGCPDDCGVCPPSCGDGTCNGNENCSTCSMDCGACPASCGDGTCDNDETCSSCPADCGACPPSCGDGTCDNDETCSSCPADCGACPPSCGDGTCDNDETCSSCPADCGACPPSCGDGTCDSGETCSSCPADCGACPPSCGDGTCDSGETCSVCPTDCGTCPVGDVITAASCARDDVASAVAQAEPGETVEVPAGTCTWTSGLEIREDIHLVGNGTEIARSSADVQLLSFHSSGELTGFHFDAGDSSELWHGDILQFSGAPRIHHNTFTSTTGHWMLEGTTEPGTLVDHNHFGGNSWSFAIILYGEGDADWDTAVDFGSSGFAFVEDNTFEFEPSSGGGNAAIDFHSGGRVVFRHNALHNSYVENHDRCRSGLASARGQEIYENTFVTDDNKWKGIDLSAGGGPIFSNTFQGDWSVPIGVYKSRDTCSLPADEVPGGLEPLYIWNNTDNGSPTGMACTSDATACSEMTYYNDTVMPGYTPFTYPHPRQGEDPVDPPTCGDGSCSGAETCSSCAADCGACPPSCGDGSCSGSEDCSSCAADCGACPASCGDGSCDGGETCSTCASDCGACPPTGDLPSGDTGIAARYANDAGIGSDSEVLFFDDFESYSSVSDLWGSYDNFYQQHLIGFATAQDNVYAGSQSLEVSVPPGDSPIYNNIARTIEPQDVVFVRYYVRMSPGFGFETGGALHTGSSVKASYPGPGQNPDGTDFFYVGLENSVFLNEPPPGYTHLYVYHPDQAGPYGDHWYPDGTVLPGYSSVDFGPDFVARANTIPDTGVWYCSELMVQANTPGQNDGRVAFWINGELAADFPNLRFRDIASLKIDEIDLGLGGPPHSTLSNSQFFDNLVIATSYVGP